MIANSRAVWLSKSSANKVARKGRATSKRGEVVFLSSESRQASESRTYVKLHCNSEDTV